jgi:chromatin remodeling complex protein RSC6
MKLQEQMDEILGKEYKFPTWFKRRVSDDYLEKRFEDSLKKETKRFIYHNGEHFVSGAKIKCDTFVGSVIGQMMNEIHLLLQDIELDYYDEVFDGLKEYYGGRIEKKYKELKMFM